MPYDEADVRWNRWWVLMWACAVAALAGLAFAWPFGRWLTAALVLFAVPEAIALARHRDSLPPLTFVTRRYVPRWVTFAALGFLCGAIGGYWFGARHPVRMGALFGLFSWALDHFTVTYDA